MRSFIHYSVYFWVCLLSSKLNSRASHITGYVSDVHFADKIWGVNNYGEYLVTRSSGLRELSEKVNATKHRHSNKQINKGRVRSNKAIVVTAVDDVDISELLRSVGITSVHDMRFRILSYGGGENNAFQIKFVDPIVANHTLDMIRESSYVIFVDYERVHRKHRDFALDYCIGAEDGQHYMNGNGIIVTIADTGLDTGHVFFSDGTIPYPKYILTDENYKTISHEFSHFGHRKVHAYLSLRYLDLEKDAFVDTDFLDQMGGHGTHVAGIAAGFSSTHTMSDSHAKILFIDMEGTGTSEGEVSVPGSIWYLMQTAYDSGSRIFTNSWGSEGCDYTAYAYEVDLFVFKYPEMSMVFSAGNQGPGNCTIASPAVAKNALAVGSSFNVHSSWKNYSMEPSYWENPDIYMLDPEKVNLNAELYNEKTLSSFSSRGPTMDGRIKPDIVVPGEWIKSARAGTKSGSLLMRGTSQAAPLAAHLLTIIDEKLRTAFGIYNPLSSLRRAILVACATPMKDGISVDERIGKGHKLDINEKSKIIPYADDGFGSVKIEPFLDGLLTVKDRIRLTMENPYLKKVYKYKDKKIQTVVFVMSYVDIPSVSSDRVLVNDIGMRVVVYNNGHLVRIYNGNDALGMGDSLNPTERIMLLVEPGDEVHVTIAAMDRLALGEQMVSYVYSSFLQETDANNKCSEYDLPMICGSANLHVLCMKSGSFDPLKCVSGCASIAVCDGNRFTKCNAKVDCESTMGVRTWSRRLSHKEQPNRLDHVSVIVYVYYFMIISLMTGLFSMGISSDFQKRYEMFNR